MKWDLALYVRGLPPEYRFHDRHFRMCDVTDNHVQSLLEGLDHMLSVTDFFEKPRQHKLTVVLFRVMAEDAGEALTLVKHRLDGFIDGLAILLDRDLPEICPLVVIREGESEDSNFVQLGSPGWAYFQPKDPAMAEQWRQRHQKVLLDLMPFFDIAAGIHPQHKTSLGKQLLYSMKMYRAGAQTDDFGLEFICKWSGLEGLVCGGEKNGKYKLLKDRLTSLLSDPADKTEELLRTLWGFRNQAVHEALAFQSDHLEDAPPLACWIERVEQLFLAVVTFALSHIDKADSVQTLWPFAASFQLPPHATQARPSEMVRVALTKVVFNTHLGSIGDGSNFDAAFTPRLEPPNTQ